MCNDNGLNKYQMALDKIRVQFDREIHKRVDAYIIAGHDLEAYAVYQMMNPDWSAEKCRWAVEDRALYIGSKAMKMAGDSVHRALKQKTTF